MRKIFLALPLLLVLGIFNFRSINLKANDNENVQSTAFVIMDTTDGSIVESIILDGYVSDDIADLEEIAGLALDNFNKQIK
jgi:hypothetical protein